MIKKDEAERKVRSEGDEKSVTREKIDKVELALQRGGEQMRLAKADVALAVC